MTNLGAIRPFVPPAIQPKGLSELPGKIPGAELQQLGSVGRPSGIAPSQPSADSFGSMLSRLVNEVGAKQAAAGASVQGLLAGENVSLHQAVVSMEEASVSFQLMVEVRNKLLESYQELMRMQI